MNLALRRKYDNPYVLRAITFLFNILSSSIYNVVHKKSDHHFVPQFILRNFKISPKEGLVYEYSPNNRNGKKKSIKKVCAFPNLYTFKDKKSQLPSDYIEDAIFANLIEEFTPNVIKQILTPGFHITYLEESILATFVGFQYARTPYNFREISRYITYLIHAKKVPEKEITDKSNFQLFFQRAFIDNYYEVDRVDYDAFQQKNNLVMQEGHNLIISLAVQMGSYLIKPLYQTKDMIMIKDDTEGVFITDNPVVVLNPETKEFMGVFLWEFPKMEVYMPLAPNRAIYYSLKNDERFKGLQFFSTASLFNSNLKAYSNKPNSFLREFFNNFVERRK